MRYLKIISLVATLSLLGACTTSTTIDEYREIDTQLILASDERVVVLGRRQSGEYETEPDFIDCIGKKLASSGQVKVVPEQQFLDNVYPWFEPRTAPLQLKRMGMMLSEPMIADRIQSMGVRYMIWVDGNTETTESDGSISCAIGPGGGGCFGFATWDKESTYEATIWDLDVPDLKGRVRVDAKGSSYLLGIGAPIPFIARVQDGACTGIGNQLRSFFAGEEPEESP